MYTYLIEKINEFGHSATVNKMTILALEALQGINSEFIKEFLFDAPDLATIFPIPQLNSKINTLNEASTDDDFVHYLVFELGFQGILAEVHFPVLQNISCDANGVLWSCTLSRGHCYTRWIYAHTVGELAVKIIDIAGEYERKAIDQHLKNLQEK